MSSPNGKPPARPSYDPKALLAPKSTTAREISARGIKETANSYTAMLEGRKTPSDSPTTNGNHTEKMISAGSLIENMHNVERREDRPTKRQKREHADDDESLDRKNTFSGGGGKGGEVSQYIKDKRKEGNNGSTSHVIDLTEDGESNQTSSRLGLPLTFNR